MHTGSVTSEKQRPAEYGAAISHGLRMWLHRFRSLHGAPYVIALEVDEACLAIRALANTEAHYRESVGKIVDPEERAKRRWATEHWLETKDGPDFELLSAVMRSSAWQPSFEAFRAMVFEAMHLGMQDAAAQGVFGSRSKAATISVFLSTLDPELAIDLRRASAHVLNPHDIAKELLEYLDGSKRH